MKLLKTLKEGLGRGRRKKFKQKNLKRSLSFIKLKQQVKPLRIYSALVVLRFFLVVLCIIISSLKSVTKAIQGSGETAQRLRELEFTSSTHTSVLTASCSCSLRVYDALLWLPWAPAFMYTYPHIDTGIYVHVIKNKNRLWALNTLVLIAPSVSV